MESADQWGNKIRRQQIAHQTGKQELGANAQMDSKQELAQTQITAEQPVESPHKHSRVHRIHLQAVTKAWFRLLLTTAG